MRAFLKHVIEALTEDHNQIAITEVAGLKSTIYEVRLSKPDFGKVIGKNGKTISAIRAIAGAVAAKDGRRITVEVVD